MTVDEHTFDVLGELPEGQVAIEASAGTGKTYTLAALATRYLAEKDVAPSELLIVTFTKAATAELRTRIRQQLVTSAAALVGDGDDFEGDDLARLLAATDRPLRRRRLERALSDFDAAAISTMHSFAAQVRNTLGITSAIDPDARLTTDVAKLVRHACADALAVSSARADSAEDLPTLHDLVTATETFVGGGDMELEPRPGREGATPAQVLLRQLVLTSWDNLVDRRIGSGTMGFDDVLTQLRDAVMEDPMSPVVDALRNRFKVVLIDEFQDTDRVQWQIFSTLFGAASLATTLVVVGDPKQAIYRFRGADISVYLEAAGDTSGAERFTLGRNWRSDGAVIEALHHLFEGATFGSDQIAFVPVRASDANEPIRMRMTDNTPVSGLAIRLAVGPDMPRKGTAKTPVAAKAGRLVERDMVAHIRGLLDGASIPDGTAPGGSRMLRPSDVAVLVASNAHARSAQTALRRQGIPAVVAGAGSVLSSWAADHVRILLAAMGKPSDLGRVRSFALSWFVPWTAAEVGSANDEQLAVLQRDLTDWATGLADHSVAEVLARIWASTNVVAQLLGTFDGDRNVTDLDHLAELLHANAPHGMSGVPGLAALLDQPPESEADLEVDGDVVARRIESDAEAVQIMTIWKAKGLQFPVVCLPMLWRPGWSSQPVIYTDPETRMRTMDLAKGADWPDASSAKERKDLARAEREGEQLRLLYVALTRAQHHVAVWWADSTGSRSRALSRFLFARGADDGVLVPERFTSETFAVPADADVLGALEGLVALSNRTITVSVVDDRQVPLGRWVRPGPADQIRPLCVAAFGDPLDRSVSRWSFSSITMHAVEETADPYDASVADSGAADEGAGDEGQVAGPAWDGPGGSGVPDAPATIDRITDESTVAASGPLGRLRAGTSFGTFVHGVLERVDFADSELGVALGDAIEEQRNRSVVDLNAVGSDADDGEELLAAGLEAAIRTPLGPLFGARCLADIGRNDRLDELSFDMRIGTGQHQATVGDIGRLVVEHLPSDHLLAPWARALAGGSIAVRLAGYLTGSIDLVARIRGDRGGDEFVVVDYKTNQLVPRGRDQRPDDYTMGSMADAMAEHHYPLQALLYAVALHRYLRSRHRAGTPAHCVTGVAYLFVRGMTGTGVPVTDGHPHGVFTWELPPGLITGLSDLLDGRPGAERAR
jgi:exodeoxyribonuclease V beta subunit